MSERKIDRDAFERLLRDGKTLVEAASELGCSYSSAVMLSRIKGNLASRLRAEKKAKQAEKKAKQLDEAVRLYRDEAYSMSAISRKLGISPSDVSVALNQRGIAIRMRNEHPLHPLRNRAVSVLQDAGFADVEIAAIMGISGERVGQIGHERLAKHEMP